ncbi:hypothetical protein [Bdellovibrio sp. NC01]|uniref:hypothetical protein n=1 Tax=Bdellovibrio sp. NC01 TaxID=2220073 RepID=UPI00115A26DC|nr:hypothetical protein [Bdellovibrio sp. NC01]QDK37849.1 hypothetical protein DOE51_09760 [Bdellovibrio sp. NC01]
MSFSLFKSTCAFLIAFAGSSTLASTVCYKALNPQNISIKPENRKVERASAARIVYQNVKSVDPSGVTIFPSLAIRAQSKSYKFKTTAYQFDETHPDDFSVECDGGKTTMKKVGGILVLNSEYLAGEIKTPDEGCATGSVSFKNLAVEETSCR